MNELTASAGLHMRPRPSSGSSAPKFRGFAEVVDRSQHASGQPPRQANINVVASELPHATVESVLQDMVHRQDVVDNLAVARANAIKVELLETLGDLSKEALSSGIRRITAQR